MSAIINAKTIAKSNKQEQEQMKKEFFISVFFDGTNNKMKTGSNTSLRQKDTNVAALSTMTKDQNVVMGNKMRYYKSYYIEGPGTTYDGDRSWIAKLANAPMDKISNTVGMAIGMWENGVIAKVARAVIAIHSYITGIVKSSKDKKDTIIHFNVYGFSRGAACARLFAYLVARDNDGKGNITYENAFQKYAPSLYNNKLLFLDGFQPQNRIVEFLGIYDTVSSIGIANSDMEIIQQHQCNARDYGLYSPQLKNVKRTFHICAMDEFRKNFAITDVGKKVPSTCIEVFVPGCHSDIGGSYEDDASSTGCIRHKLNGRPTRMMTKDPRDKSSTENVTQQSLLHMGWAVEKGFLELIGEKLTSTLKESYETSLSMNLLQETISFKRNVKRGLSNITLKMMWERANKDIKAIWGFEPFSHFEHLSEFTVPNEIQSFTNMMDSKKLKYGERKWLIPMGSLSSTSYQFLRSNYIHYSSTDRFGFSVVNAPNWTDNLLCRIVFHGDENDTKVYHTYDLQ